MASSPPPLIGRDPEFTSLFGGRAVSDVASAGGGCLGETQQDVVLLKELLDQGRTVIRQVWLDGWYNTKLSREFIDRTR